ncbi:MAG: helix-turn-helix transcriptional regulator [Muribaculaceae bacterium]|nr:helix-turn-helix transcriptional regulator [Muribaculaceae bacterium]
MEIPEIIEYNIILLGWVIALLLGVFLILIKPPHNKANEYFKQGKNTLGIVFMLFSFELLFQWFLRQFEIANPILSVSVYLLCFFTATLLITDAFCTLLKSRSNSDARFKIRRIAIISFLIYFILLTINYFLPGMKTRAYGLLVCGAILFITAWTGLYFCISFYRKAIIDLKKYYSDLVESMLQWMPGVAVGVLIFLLSAPFVCFCPRWVGVYQVALGIFIFIYIFVCIINFSFKYSSLATALTTDEANQDTDSGEDECVMSRQATMSASLQEVLQDKETRWLEHGGYLVPGITIEQTARDMGTNRNYLSKYLNEIKHLTFYEWIAQLRIQEAQSLMRNDSSLSMEQIARQVGYTSYSTFSNTFKKISGLSPKEWRNRK